jgi:hypothetical protein
MVPSLQSSICLSTLLRCTYSIENSTIYMRSFACKRRNRIRDPSSIFMSIHGLKGKCRRGRMFRTVMNGSAGSVFCMINHTSLFDFKALSDFCVQYIEYDLTKPISMIPASCIRADGPREICCGLNGTSSAHIPASKGKRVTSMSDLDATILIVPHRYTTDVWVCHLTPTRSVYGSTCVHHDGLRIDRHRQVESSVS